MTKLKSIVIAAIALVVFANITNAQVVTTNYSVSAVNAEEPLKVKYLGSEGSYLLFQVTLQNDNAENARLAIDDKKDGQIYSSGISNNLKVSTVKVEKTEPEQVLKFKLFLGKKVYSKTFSINTNLVETTTVAETDITKL